MLDLYVELKILWMFAAEDRKRTGRKKVNTETLFTLKYEFNEFNQVLLASQQTFCQFSPYLALKCIPVSFCERTIKHNWEK